MMMMLRTTLSTLSLLLALYNKIMVAEIIYAMLYDVRCTRRVHCSIIFNDVYSYSSNGMMMYSSIMLCYYVEDLFKYFVHDTK